MVTGTLPDANIPDDITITGLSGTNSGDNAVNTNYSGLAVTSTSVTDGTNTFNKATDFVSATSGGTFGGNVRINRAGNALDVRKTNTTDAVWTATFCDDDDAPVTARAHDHVLIQSADVPSLRIHELDANQSLGVAVGDGNATIASTETLRFFVGGNYTGSPYSGLAGTQCLIFAKATGDATFGGKVTAPSLILTPSSTPTATEGAIYYDSTSNLVKVYNGSAWDSFNQSASGGTITTYSSGGVTYMVHTFLSSGTFTTLTAITADILVVAGGGGGGWDVGGGGGAGGMGVWSDKSLSGNDHTVTVGAGGATAGSNSVTGASGTDSQFGDLGAISGGGGGGTWSQAKAGATGGSSGGHAGWSHSNGTSTSATYNTSGVALSGGLVYGAVGGYNTENANSVQGAGGGGAGGVGGNAIQHGSGSGRTENGGDGKANDFRTGSNVTYARGGCGGNDSGSAEGYRGAGDDNTGEGGAGAGSSTGQAGGSGIVIIRYAI